jgi:hypothetical protein
MALQSPGVEVTVIDESFYTPAEAGTTPLIVVATAQDKRNGAGTGTASATTKANVGKAFKLTGQRDLTELFGVPFFEKTASSTPIHGSERNEYGLLAAYSLLGVSNAAFIVRANVDLSELEAQVDAPGANPTNGQWWIDTQATTWGIQEWNGLAPSVAGGQRFTNKVPMVLTDSDSAKIINGKPKDSVGSIGDYAVVFQTVVGDGSFGADEELARLYYKSPGNGGVAGGGTAVSAGEWVLVGSPAWKASWPLITATVAPLTTATAGILYINDVTLTLTDGDTAETIAGKIASAGITGVTATWVSNRLSIYSNGASGLGDSTNSAGVVDLESGSANWSNIGGIAAGLYLALKLQQSPHTQIPAFKISDNLSTKNGAPTGSVWIKTTEPNDGARLRVKRWNTGTESWVSSEAPMYDSTSAATYFLDRSGAGLNIFADALFTQVNAREGNGFDDTPSTVEFRVWHRNISANSATTATSNTIVVGTLSASEYSFTMAESVKGQAELTAAKLITVTINNNDSEIAEKFASAINAAGFVNVVASVITVSPTATRLVISHKLGGDFRITDLANNPIGGLFTAYDINTRSGNDNFYSLATLLVSNATETFLVSGWKPLAADNPRFAASKDEPLNESRDEQLWYNPNFSQVDIMVHNGSTWVGYRFGGAGSIPSPFYDTVTTRIGYAPIVSASNPYVDSMETGDLWISTADLENYPTIYRYNSDLTDIANVQLRWELVDKADQTTEEGVLFADARWNINGKSTAASTIEDLLVSNFLDFDAPDPALYPKGMLLWNLRRSGGNVKKYVNNYVNTANDNARSSTGTLNGETFVSGSGLAMDEYWTDRWVTASPNNEDGSGSFGRKAQRGVVVAAMKSVIDTSQEIRDEERRNFNLISAPGYPELMSNLVNLNIDRGVTAFVVGDTPLRLASDATSLTTWGTNANLVTDNGDDGIVTYDEYLACYYPNGFTTDLSGASAVVPASHMMLKTIALSDNVSFPWFAPAGTRRGGITNATAVGYIDSLSGEFLTVALNEGQRDTLYDLKINPIPFFNGVGLVAYGQKTRARNASALDRINVARLIVYMRSQLNKLARPYIFEPNDKITRDEIKQACESLMLELVGLRALYDFAVVCDESNNTPSRIDRNELYVDIAIQPVKAVEFIYIPLRVQNTGEF